MYLIDTNMKIYLDGGVEHLSTPPDFEKKN